MDMSIVRGLCWGMFLGQVLELREALLMVGHMMRILGVFKDVLLVIYQMGSFLVILGKTHW